MLAAAMPAFAQLNPEPPIGSRIPKALDQFPVDRSRVIVTKFGACVAKKNGALAREFVLSGRSYFLTDHFSPLASSQCLGEAIGGSAYGMVALTLTPAVLRYAIADALVRNDLQTFDATIIAFAAPLAELQVNRADYRPARKTSAAADWQKAEQRAKNELAFIQYGECVVRANPNAARTLLSTKVNSEDEGAALIGLLPTFQGCLERGKEFSASRLILRGTIAFNYYRLAYGRRMPASTTPARQ